MARTDNDPNLKNPDDHMNKHFQFPNIQCNHSENQ